LSKIIELLGLERFRKRIPRPRRHPRFRGCGLAPAIPPPRSPRACLPAGVDQAAIHLHGADGEGVEPLQTGVAGAVIIQVEAVGPVQAERPAIAGQAGCRQGGARKGGGSQADLSGRLRFAIRPAVSLTKPWPSASGRCRTTGVPILCRKRSSRAISPSWLDRLASSGSLPRVSSPPSASSQGSFRGRALGTWISPLTKPAAAAAAGPARQPAAPLRGAAAQGVPPGAGAVPGRGGVGS
jgi:hypothetical protein